MIIMKLIDAIDTLEHRFLCRLGYPGPTVSGNPDDERRYVMMRMAYSIADAVWGQPTLEIIEHVLVSKTIATLTLIADKMHRAGNKRPHLHYRWHDKLRLHMEPGEVNCIRARLYIDGCQDYGIHHVKPQDVDLWAPSPCKLVIDNTRNKLMLTLNTTEEVTI